MSKLRVQSFSISLTLKWNEVRRSFFGNVLDETDSNTMGVGLLDIYHPIEGSGIPDIRSR